MIHVLTLSWDGLDKLKTLRPGLMRNLEKTGQEFKWYIKDNGSKDRTYAETYSWENTICYPISHNRDNFATGINELTTRIRDLVVKQDPETKAEKRIISESPHIIRYEGKSVEELMKNDYYLFMNNDIEFGEDDALCKILKLMDDKDVGMVGCRLLYKGTDKLQHAGVIFSPKYGNMPYHYRHQENSDTQAEKNRYFQAVTAAVTLVRCSDFDEVGGMDNKFHWAFEDIDLCLRIKALGKKIAYCGDTKIFHEESASLKKNPVNKLFMGPNVSHFKSKWQNKYELDHDKYLKDIHYNEIK
jgi:GT2 family glycosyltransferase